MQQDMMTMQAAMAQEIARLSSMSHRAKGSGAQQFSSRTGARPGVVPPSGRTNGSGKTGLTPPSSLRSVREEEGEEPTWGASARRFLPAWAQPAADNLNA